jgi:hypothetical protein
MNPWLVWYAFASAEERKAMEEAMKEALRDWQTLLVAPVCLGLVLGAAMII